MAYLRDIVRTCSALGCTKVATVELCNNLNAPMGAYCQKHGSLALRDQTMDEQSRYERKGGIFYVERSR